MTIKPTDAVIVCARNEDEVSHLEACFAQYRPFLLPVCLLVFTIVTKFLLCLLSS